MCGLRIDADRQQPRINLVPWHSLVGHHAGRPWGSGVLATAPAMNPGYVVWWWYGGDGPHLALDITRRREAASKVNRRGRRKRSKFACTWQRGLRIRPSVPIQGKPWVAQWPFGRPLGGTGCGAPVSGSLSTGSPAGHPPLTAMPVRRLGVGGSMYSQALVSPCGGRGCALGRARPRDKGDP